MSEETKKSQGGRPEWNPTKAQRRQVSIAAAGGMTQEQIAIAMDVSLPTLIKHCRYELTQGAYQKRLEIVQCMYQAAKKGNVSAQKSYIALLPDPVFPTSAEPDKPEPVGKKERQQAEAAGAHVGSEWEDLLSKQPVQ